MKLSKFDYLPLQPNYSSTILFIYMLADGSFEMTGSSGAKHMAVLIHLPINEFIQVCFYLKRENKNASEFEDFFFNFIL